MKDKAYLFSAVQSTDVRIKDNHICRNAHSHYLQMSCIVNDLGNAYHFNISNNMYLWKSDCIFQTHDTERQTLLLGKVMANIGDKYQSSPYSVSIPYITWVQHFLTGTLLSLYFTWKVFSDFLYTHIYTLFKLR